MATLEVWRRGLGQVAAAHGVVVGALRRAGQEIEDQALGVAGDVDGTWRVLRDAIDAARAVALIAGSEGYRIEDRGIAPPFVGPWKDADERILVALRDARHAAGTWVSSMKAVDTAGAREALRAAWSNIDDLARVVDRLEAGGPIPAAPAAPAPRALARSELTAERLGLTRPADKRALAALVSATESVCGISREVGRLRLALEARGWTVRSGKFDGGDKGYRLEQLPVASPAM